MLPLLQRPSLKELLRHTREAAVCEMELSHQRVMRDGGVLRIEPLQARRDGRRGAVSQFNLLFVVFHVIDRPSGVESTPTTTTANNDSYCSNHRNTDPLLLPSSPSDWTKPRMHAIPIPRLYISPTRSGACTWWCRPTCSGGTLCGRVPRPRLRPLPPGTATSTCASLRWRRSRRPAL